MLAVHVSLMNIRDIIRGFKLILLKNLNDKKRSEVVFLVFIHYVVNNLSLF